MKKLIIFLLIALPFVLNAQQTYVPDDNFEQALIYLDLDSFPLNDSVTTKNIDTLTYLDVHSKNISDLTGIEDFLSLNTLICNWNSIANLDVSKNTALTYLNCFYNHLTSLDVSKNTALKELYCYDNPYLYCIQVPDSAFAAKNSKWKKDKVAIWSEDCANAVLDLRQTYVPDNNFELALYYKGLDSGLLNDSIPTKFIDTVKFLDVSGKGIHDLTGIEDFKEIEALVCHDNSIKKLDLKSNLFIKALSLSFNDFDFLDLSNNRNLEILGCYNCKYLRFINIKNGNNKNMGSSDNYMELTGNPELSCIQVDDSAWSANNKYWFKDKHAIWSENCNYTGVEDDIIRNKSVSISPNPASDYIEISVGAQRAVPADVTILDILGVSILKVEQNTPSVQRIDVSGLSPGVYFVRVGDSVQRFIKY